MGLIVCSIYGRVPITGGEGMLVLGQKARVSEKVGSGAARNEGWSYGSVIFSHIMFYHDFAHVF